MASVVCAPAGTPGGPDGEVWFCGDPPEGAGDCAPEPDDPESDDCDPDPDGGAGAWAGGAGDVAGCEGVSCEEEAFPPHPASENSNPKTKTIRQMP
jgi:hypothetical protein